MSHELNVKNGIVSMMYNDEVPWHKLGTRVEGLQTAEDTIKLAGLDYTVEKKPIQAIMNSANIEIPNRFATVRTDTNQVLGIVGKKYNVVQNTDAFEFFNAIVGEGEAIYETAGALGNGERIWLLAKLPDYIKVNGDDIVDKYLLLTNSHDGSSIIRAKLTPIRVVCQNTLTVSLNRDKQEEVRIRHTSNCVDMLQQAHQIIGLTNHLYDQLENIFQNMASKQITNNDLTTYVEHLFPNNEEAVRTTRTENIREAVYELHECGVGAEMSKGTVWGMYNAVTEYTDHIYANNKADKALNNIWFGSKANLKLNAYKTALDFLN